MKNNKTKQFKVKRYISNFCKGRWFNFSKLTKKFSATKKCIQAAIKELIKEGFNITISEDVIIASRI